jgi:hypothetical protein
LQRRRRQPFSPTANNQPGLRKGPRCSRSHELRDLAAMADFEEMVPSPLSVEEEDELWTGTLILLLKLTP